MPPRSKLIYAKNEVIIANIPLSLCLLSTMRPIAKINKNIPANDIHILSIDSDIVSPLHITIAIFLHIVLYHTVSILAWMNLILC
jgi:hypothetical protein